MSELIPPTGWTDATALAAAARVAADSDGIDGTEDAAGAFVNPDTLARLVGLDSRACLDRHDSHSLFAGTGDLICTGPTGTNVNDIRAILITRGGREAD